MRAVKFLFIALLFALAACGPVTPAPVATTTASPTLQPSATPRPTSTRTPTRIPPTPIPTSYLPQEVSDSSLTCIRGPRYTSCYDELLATAFEYPNEWGEIGNRLAQGGYSGYIYSYSIRPFGEEPVQVAGGISRDFSEGREWYFFDFGSADTSEQPAEEICDWMHAQTCREVRPGVIFMVRPNAELLCEMEMIQYFFNTWPPMVIVIVQLPERPTINGFLFLRPLDSEAIQQEILARLGIPDLQTPLYECSEETIQAYNAFLEELALGQPSGSVDAETAQIIQDMLHLAESIEFR